MSLFTRFASLHEVKSVRHLLVTQDEGVGWREGSLEVSELHFVQLILTDCADIGSPHNLMRRLSLVLLLFWLSDLWALWVQASWRGLELGLLGLGLFLS